MDRTIYRETKKNALTLSRLITFLGPANSLNCGQFNGTVCTFKFISYKYDWKFQFSAEVDDVEVTDDKCDITTSVFKKEGCYVVCERS